MCVHARVCISECSFIDMWVGRCNFMLSPVDFSWGSGEPLVVQIVHKQRKCLESLICILVTSSTITTVSEQLVSKKYRGNGPQLKWSVERLACSH